VLVFRAEEDVPIDVGDGGELRRGRGQCSIDRHHPDTDAGGLDLVGERIDEFAQCFRLALGDVVPGEHQRPALLGPHRGDPSSDQRQDARELGVHGLRANATFR